MVDAKDSFYIALRDRLTVLNPQRTMVVRGALRPGILVEEAEPAGSQLPRDVYVLRWTGVCRDLSLPSTLMMLNCEIEYCTAGSDAACGLDRGRFLAAMDGEVGEMLEPASTPTMCFDAIPAASTGGTTFWSVPSFGPTTINRDCLGRVVKVTVFARMTQGDE